MERFVEFPTTFRGREYYVTIEYKDYGHRLYHVKIHQTKQVRKLGLFKQNKKVGVYSKMFLIDYLSNYRLRPEDDDFFVKMTKVTFDEYSETFADENHIKKIKEWDGVIE